MVAEDSSAVPNFIGYFKKETAHAINRLTGNTGQTLWETSYDAPVMLDAAKVKEKN